jgi:hypothetical protein
MAIIVDLTKDPGWQHPRYPYGTLVAPQQGMWHWLETALSHYSWAWDTPITPAGNFVPGIWVGFTKADDYAMFVLKWK